MQPPAVQPQVIYAVGDIHGRLDLLNRALAAVETHARRRPHKLIFLGDYIDRGPESRGVIERLMALQKAGRAVCLKGNHEDLMIKALEQPRSANERRWLDNGGRQTLVSYGVADGQDANLIVPREHIRWMSGLPLTTTDGKRIFVHAGLAPKVPFHRQTEEACLWIRERFLRAKAKDFESHIVHGHTPLWEGKPDHQRPELLPHRTNLDTAAFASGVLSVGVFDPALPGGPMEVLAIAGAPQDHSRRETLDPVDGV